MGGEEKPDWESLDSDSESTEDELVIKNPLFAAIFHWGMILLMVSLAFLLCGGLFWLVLNSGELSEFTEAKSEKAAWGQFITGGVLGVLSLILRYFEPIKKRWR